MAFFVVIGIAESESKIFEPALAPKSALDSFLPDIIASESEFLKKLAGRGRH